MKRIMRILSIILLTAVVCIPGVSALPAYANSAQTYFFGVDANGTFLLDESPIVVEKEVLTFDIDNFPDNYYETAEDYAKYDARVTAEYTFYNPADYTVTSRLLFPFGNLPSYVGYDYDETTGEESPYSDTDKYDITIDGEAIEKEIRHTLISTYEYFETDRDTAWVCDGFVEDEFFSPDMTVTEYVYDVDSRYFGFDIPYGKGNYRVCLPSQKYAYPLESGNMRIGGEAGYNTIEVSLFIFGEPWENPPKCGRYGTSGLETRYEDGLKLRPKTIRTITFSEFALSNWSKDLGVSQNDWCNAVVAEMNESGYANHPIVSCYKHNLKFESELMRWYEYEITLAPGQRIVNGVTAPIYPSIDSDWNPSIYEYTYLLSPAKTWKSFGELKIVVNTPFFLVDTETEGFEKTDTGYELTLPTLPEGELRFTLSSSEEPEEPKVNYGYLILFSLPIIGIGIVIFSVVGGIIALVVIICKIRKKKKIERKEE